MTGAAEALTADKLAAELAALHERQAALHEALTRRNVVDADAAKAVDSTFSRLPEYVEKLHRMQQAMDALAARTSQMRTRCLDLLQEHKPQS